MRKWRLSLSTIALLALAWAFRSPPAFTQDQTGADIEDSAAPAANPDQPGITRKCFIDTLISNGKIEGRTVRASWIAQVMLGSTPVKRRPLLINTMVVGKLAFVSGFEKQRIPIGLTCKWCRFPEGIEIAQSDLNSNLSFVACLIDHFSLNETIASEIAFVDFAEGLQQEENYSEDDTKNENHIEGTNDAKWSSISELNNVTIVHSPVKRLILQGAHISGAVTIKRSVFASAIFDMLSCASLDIDRVTFTGNTSFALAEFAEATFRSVTFAAQATFENVSFADGVSFEGVSFLDDTAFNKIFRMKEADAADFKRPLHIKHEGMGPTTGFWMSGCYLKGRSSFDNVHVDFFWIASSNHGASRAQFEKGYQF